MEMGMVSIERRLSKTIRLTFQNFRDPFLTITKITHLQNGVTRASLCS